MDNKSINQQVGLSSFHLYLISIPSSSTQYISKFSWLDLSVPTWPVPTWFVPNWPVVTWPVMTWLVLTCLVLSSIALFKKKICNRKFPGPKKYWSQNIWAQRNIGSRKSWENNLYPKLFVSKKIRAPKFFWNFWDTFFVPSRHPLYTLQTPSRHSPHTIETPTKFQPPVLHISWIFN